MHQQTDNPKNSKRDLEWWKVRLQIAAACLGITVALWSIVDWLMF